MKGQEQYLEASIARRQWCLMNVNEEINTQTHSTACRGRLPSWWGDPEVAQAFCILTWQGLSASARACQRVTGKALSAQGH